MKDFMEFIVIFRDVTLPKYIIVVRYPGQKIEQSELFYDQYCCISKTGERYEHYGEIVGRFRKPRKAKRLCNELNAVDQVLDE